ncbi:MAG: hypothetical protein IKP88_07035 [Lachnospiraceae bacterium]|nr:hypothetical protein [Lachnospiraceae bacterium]
MESTYRIAAINVKSVPYILTYMNYVKDIFLMMNHNYKMIFSEEDIEYEFKMAF